MPTVSELRTQRDKLKSDHKLGTEARRRQLTDQIAELMKQVRRYERQNGLTADLPADKQPTELRKLTVQVEALKAERAPHLRPVELELVQAQLRVAVEAEHDSQVATEAAEMKLAELDDSELEQQHHTLAAEFAPLSRALAAVSAERSRRAAEAERVERYKGMTKAEKLAELEALKRDLAEE